MLNSNRTETLEVQARELEARAHALVEQLRLARGTREIAPPAPPTTETALADRLVTALRASPSSIEDLAAALGAPVGRVAKEMRALRARKGVRLWNAGTDDAPRWWWPPAADASSEEFMEAVRALISIRPYSTGELQKATGTERSKRVWHALCRLNDAPESRLVRSGDRRRPTWFWLPKGFDLAKLAGR